MRGVSDVGASSRTRSSCSCSLVKRIVCFTILGAILNVIVIWGYAYRPINALADSSAPFPPLGTMRSRQYTNESIPTETNLSISRFTTWVSHILDASERNVVFGVPIQPEEPIGLPEWCMSADELVEYIEPGRTVMVTGIETAFGWPWRALSTRQVRVLESPVKQRYPIKDQFMLPQWTQFGHPERGTRREMPIHPIWLGLLGNSALYGMLLFVFAFSCGAVRRQTRRRRGRCPRCAYPIGASPVCTECGQPIR